MENRGLQIFDLFIDVNTLVFRSTQSLREDLLYPPTFGWPSPSSSSNDWMSELSAAVHPNGPSGGSNHNDIDLNETNSQDSCCPNTNPKHIFAKDTSDEAKGRLMLKKLTKYPHLRKSLNSLNIARAYKDGVKSFGKMSWYTENFRIGRGLKSNVERRKFRFGLKSNVDFLLQLDLANLKTCLLDKTQDTHFPQPTSTSSLSDGSFLNLMQKMNLTRSQEFCKIFNRLESNLTILQTMTCWNLLRWSFLMLCVRVQTWAKGCGDARWQLMHCYTDSARPPTTASSTLDGKPIEMTDILPAIQHVIARRILKGLGPHTETLFPQNIPKDHVFVSKP